MPHPTVNPTETSNEQASMEAWISSLNAPLRTRIMPVSPEPECETPRDSSAAKAKRQREFAAGRRCCESLLKQFGNSEQVWANADRSPAWPLGFTGSISHSKNWTWAAVAEQTELVSVGIDTEPVLRPNWTSAGNLN